MTDVRPPIPVRLAHRSTVGGLVQPWVNITLADGTLDFRGIHGTRWRQAWTERRCQTCGQPHSPLMVFLGGTNQIADGGYFDEPPLHPECAAYVRQACPMVAGRMHHYRAGPSVTEGPRGDACGKPGCACGGYTASDQLLHGDGSVTIRRADQTSGTGAPAHAWYAVTARGYQLAVTPEGQLLGGIPVDVVRTQEVSRP
ncbi:hypothetical protein [Nonomuraea sp. bgisy101]|uniref:hypothetical protein n=1 Tax=Nonomuraea sp. bgisy101 TaxID=3413784 RepID=UPI003D7174F3